MSQIRTPSPILGINDAKNTPENYLEGCKKLFILEEGQDYELHFEDEAAAKQCLSRLQAMVSVGDADIGHHAQDEFKKYPYYFRLTTHEWRFLQQAIRKKEMNITIQDDFVFKSLRADDKCYFRGFIETVSNSFEKRSLRQGKKKKFTVTGEGLFRRPDRARKYLDIPVKQPQYTEEEKSKFSKFQSATLGMPDFYPGVFGLNKSGNRNNLIIGMLSLNPDSWLYSQRLYAWDGGTVLRPYDADELDEARKYMEKNLGAKLFSTGNITDFKNAIRKKPKSYNEVLVRMSWTTDGLSKLFIASDTFEARVMARDYARILLSYLKETGCCPDGYEVPICYYSPGNPQHLKEYSKAEQHRDQLLAVALFANQSTREDLFQKERYEFLLDIPGDELKGVFDTEYQDHHIVLKILEKGYIHIVQSLYEKADFSWDEVLMKALMQEQDHHTLCHVYYHCLRSGDAKLIALFDGIKIDVNMRDNNNKTPLILAIENQQLGVVKALLAHPDINAHCFYTNNPASFNLNKNKKESYEENIPSKRMTKKKIEVDSLEGLGLLHLAVFYGNTDIVLTLLGNSNVNVNAKQYQKELYTGCLTALQFAALSGNADMVKALLTHPNIEIYNKTKSPGYTAFSLAVINKHVKAVKALLMRDDSFDYLNNENDWKYVKKFMTSTDYSDDFKRKWLVRLCENYIKRESGIEHPSVDDERKNEKLSACRYLLSHIDMELKADEAGLKKHLGLQGHDELKQMYALHDLFHSHKTIPKSGYRRLNRP